jgi:urease accessory protein
MNALPDSALPGWQARLELGFGYSEGRTRLTHRLHRGPLMVQRPFYPEGASCHVYVIHPPGGVVSGDELSLDVEVGAQAHALLTTPAAGKFYRRYAQRVACLTQALRVDGGVLEWLPQENIYYPDAIAQLSTVVQLQGNARFLGWEIGCFGLPAKAQDLGGGSIRQGFELWHDHAPMLLERLTIDREVLHSRWGLAGYTACGTMLAFPAEARHLEQARAIAAKLNEAGAQRLLSCTLIGKTLCCRGYAARADRLKQAFIDLWSALRVTLLGRAAVPPRIWKT